MHSSNVVECNVFLNVGAYLFIQILSIKLFTNKLWVIVTGDIFLYGNLKYLDGNIDRQGRNRQTHIDCLLYAYDHRCPCSLDDEQICIAIRKEMCIQKNKVFVQ